MSIFRNDEHVQFVNNGQKVLAAVGGGKAKICTVTQAAGYHAYVESDDGTLSRWYEIYDLYDYEEYRRRLAARDAQEKKCDSTPSSSPSSSKPSRGSAGT